MPRAFVVLLAFAACHHEAPAPMVAAPAAVAVVAPVVVPDAAPPPPDAPAIVKNIDSADILAREATTDEVEVQHILIAWKQRTNDEAAALALELAGKLRANPAQLDALAKQYSEDAASAKGATFIVDASAGFVPEFKSLALRLHDGEVGIVASTFGYHVMMKVPPDPLVSWAIMARAPQSERAFVQHVLIGWTTSGDADPRARDRTKDQADVLAKAVFVKARGGADMTKLMLELSEDPESAPSGKAFEVTPTSPMVGQFRAMALRLRMGEVGIVKTRFGWHVMKRVAPPPPDSLESKAILARHEVTQAAKVKHILLGWNAVNADDPRGMKRTRAELETLVKATLRRLAKGEAFETLMAELSEDPGSAKGGTAYDVTPTASLVKPFLLMSLRLNVGELGVVKTDFGIHIIKRVE